MADKVDRLFAKLPPSLMRHDDGALCMDPTHPDVQEIRRLIRVCIEAGDSEETILFHMMRGVNEAFRRLESE